MIKLAVLVIVLIMTVSGKGSLDPGQEAAVKSVFRDMLKIQLPSQQDKKLSFIPPKHMLELYRKYTSGGGSRKMNANTVRSIEPNKGVTTELLLFNVTCVSPSEEVSLAQLHLHRRRLARHHHWPNNRRVLAPPYRVRLYQLGGRGGRTTHLASVPVPHATRGGWHALDITPVLRELLLSNIQGPHLLGVRFEAPKGRQVSPTHFLKQPSHNESGNSPSFLVIFSEDNEIADDGTETHVRLVPPHTHAMVEMIQTAQSNLNDADFSQESVFQSPNTTDEDFYIETSDYPLMNEDDSNHRHKHKLRKYESGDNNDLNFLDNQPLDKNSRRHQNNLGSIVSNKIEDPTSGSRRVIRSVLDNELPDVEVSPPDNIQKTVITKRPNHKHKAKHSTIPLPAGQSGKRARGNRKRKGRDRKRQEVRANVKKENEWQPETRTISTTSSSQLCERKSMNVDFHEVGWDEFIIAPLSFEAYYCSGECMQPVKHLRKPTNHAMIQSMVHEGRSEIPSPCCVPEKLSSISFLYLDENGNVVLKNYVDMVVDSCACR